MRNAPFAELTATFLPLPLDWTTTTCRPLPPAIVPLNVAAEAALTATASVARHARAVHTIRCMCGRLEYGHSAV